jgi:ADP-ribose pyrophosphatase YjhB (NUDIX family)
MNDNIIVCSGALIYSLDTRRFLFLHRAQGKKSDLWGLVGGTNEGKETPWEGLKREIFEEVGEIEIKKTIPLETFVSNDTLNLEHNGYAWSMFNKWPKPLHFGLKNTLSNKINLSKLETVMKVIDLLD